ncbi:MAG: TPM domain-containing protein [Clostridia bacterium]|nr:TPM domain-containing protein [Clostridia bacterium]
MKRRIITFFLFFSALISCGYAESPRVYDNAGIFSAEEKESLEKSIAIYRQETKTDFCILTTNDFLGENNQLEIAELFFDSCDIGLGPNKDGVLFYLDMYHRIPAICTSGIMIQLLSGITLDACFESSYPHLKDNNFEQGAKACMDFTHALIADYWKNELEN